MPPEGELRAAIVQDAETGRVLMLAWMDDEAERRTRESGRGVVLEPLPLGVLAQGRDLRQHARGGGAPRRLRRRRPAAARAACRALSATPARSRASPRRSGARSPSAPPSAPRAATRRSCSRKAFPPSPARSARRRSRTMVAAFSESDERVVSEVGRPDLPPVRAARRPRPRRRRGRGRARPPRFARKKGFVTMSTITSRSIAMSTRAISRISRSPPESRAPFGPLVCDRARTAASPSARALRYRSRTSRRSRAGRRSSRSGRSRCRRSATIAMPIARTTIAAGAKIFWPANAAIFAIWAIWSPSFGALGAAAP